jgi:DNA-3-methyladenine glycosylase
MTEMLNLPALPRDFYARHPVDVGPEMLGRILVHATPDGPTAGVIVEVEAYATGDRASHTYRGKTPRNAAMFGPPGHAYVYRSHGIHCCVNAVCQPIGLGEAVLIRALEPIAGLDLMRARRGLDEERLLCAGPGRLCEALAITLERYGADLCSGPLRIVGDPPAGIEVIAGSRIGIREDSDRPWRFCVSGSRFLSRRAS